MRHRESGSRTIIKSRDVIFFEHILDHPDVSRLTPGRNILDQPIDDPSSSGDEDAADAITIPTTLGAQLTFHAPNTATAAAECR